jgi:hypothetical protein
LSSLTAVQLTDLVTIFSRYVARGNLERFSSLALGRDITKEAGNAVADTQAFARCVVDVLSKADKLWELIHRVREEAHKNSDLAVNLATVLSGGGLLTDEQTQAFTQDAQPLFQSATLHQIENAVCAIGLGNPVNRIVGTGFLVGPALVITNYHVLKNFLRVDPATDEVVENGSGDQIFCFFDYVSPPAPDVPPIDGRINRYVTVRALAEKWLRRGRIELPNDGTSGLQVLNHEYDYVVIELERAIGNEPLRPSGGETRGWLSLPAMIDPVGEQRLLLVQHPEGMPRVFDVGDFDSLDDSSTRVRYFVSTEKGSSGSPACGTNGVFALHNATVKLPLVNGKKRNQGVRIDKIAGDLGPLAGFGTAVPAGATAASRFWSLNDDIDAPRPIIGRSQFVDHVNAMRNGAPERVLAVSGPPGSGRHFSIELLQRYLGASVPVAVFTPTELADLEPAPFLEVLMDQLGVRGASAVAIPEPNPNEGIPQWLGVDLPRWLSDRLIADEALLPARYPVWIVLDVITAKGKQIRWAKHLRDFLVGLAGAADPVRQPIDIPQLRWLVLGATTDALALTGVKRREEDLTAWTTAAEDFKNCLRLAWRAIGAPENQFADSGFEILMNMADNDAQASNIPRRLAMAERVAQIVAADPKRRR